MAVAVADEEMKCPKCGSEDLATLADFGQGTSRRYWVGCGDCGHVFRSACDPEGTCKKTEPNGIERVEAKIEAAIEANRQEGPALIEAYDALTFLSHRRR